MFKWYALLHVYSELSTTVLFFSFPETSHFFCYKLSLKFCCKHCVLYKCVSDHYTPWGLFQGKCEYNFSLRKLMGCCSQWLCPLFACRSSIRGVSDRSGKGLEQ